MSLCIPTKILDQHLVVLGKTGAGKSSALRHIVEYLLDKKKRVCIIDPKGDWVGLKVSADGKSPGYPVILFGDFKGDRSGDVPINAQSGKHVAELITSGNRPCVIGFRGWTVANMTQFWIDFAAGIFNANSGELFLVGDEFHNFAPKGKIMDPQAGKCLHWSNRLLSEGRGLGIVCLIASQRPQKVHNDTLTSCETLVAMRVVHTADRNAVEDWIDGCGDKERGKEVLNSLAGMARGEAFVWSPEIGFGPKRVTFPMFKTFDSFAPPQLQGRINESGWADVDLTAVKEKLAAVIERAKAEDPRELQKQVAILRRELIAAKEATDKVARPRAEIKTIEVPTVGKRAISGLQATETAMRKAQAVLIKAQNAMAESVNLFSKRVEELAITIAKAQAMNAGNSQIAKDKRPPIQVLAKPISIKSIHREIDNGKLGYGERQCLIAIAQHPHGVTPEHLTVLTGYKRSSRNTYLQRLKAAGYVGSDRDRLIASQEGISMLGNDYQPLPIGAELREHYKHSLPEGERKIFTLLDRIYPETVDPEKIDEETGYQRSSRNTYLQRLSARGLVSRRGTGIELSAWLFTE